MYGGFLLIEPQVIRLAKMANALKQNTTLPALNLSGRIEFTKTLLLSNEEIVRLDVILTAASCPRFFPQDTPLSQRCATAAADALKVNTTLRTLILGANPFTSKGVAAIVSALQHNTSLM